MSRSSTPPGHSPINRSLWLGLAAALICATGADEVLTLILMIAGRVWALLSGVDLVWTENIHSLQSGSALVVIVFRAVSYGCGGWLGAQFAPLRQRRVIVWMMGMGLITTQFAQFPPGGLAAMAVWGLSAPVAIAGGVLAAWRGSDR